MKLILLTLILCTSVFGDTVNQQQHSITPALPSVPSEQEQKISELEQTVTDLALQSILGFFKPEIHESIRLSIEEALSETDARNISHIVQLLAQKFENKNDIEMSAEAVKHLIIGMGAAINLIMEESSQHQEEALPVTTSIVATPAEATSKETLVAAPSHVTAGAPSIVAPHQKAPQAAISAHAAPPPANGSHLAVRNTNLQ